MFCKIQGLLYVKVPVVHRNARTQHKIQLVLMPQSKKDEIALMTVIMAKMSKALKLRPSCSCSL